MKSLNTAFSFAPPSILSLTISASVGYACGRYADINKIICEADEKMYENKRVRRD